jgi:uncharacterized protein
MRAIRPNSVNRRYTQIEDIDAIAEQAHALGGALCFLAFDAPGFGRMARIDDPAGAGVYVVGLNSEFA